MKVSIGILATCLLCLPFYLQADDKEEGLQAFAKANEAYQAENYPEAIRLYESILAQNLSSSEVYFNLGNAYHKQGEVAESILNYERALLLAPHNEDIRYNLAIVQSTRVIDNIEPLPDLFLLGGIRRFFLARSSKQWAYISLLMIWMAVMTGGAFVFVKASGIRRWTFFGGITFAILAVTALSLSLGRKNLELNSEEGIIINPNVYVKDAPGGKTDLIILHEGVKVSIADSLDGWYNIKLEDVKVGRLSGWVPANSLEKI